MAPALPAAGLACLARVCLCSDGVVAAWLAAHTCLPALTRLADNSLLWLLLRTALSFVLLHVAPYVLLIYALLDTWLREFGSWITRCVG